MSPQQPKGITAAHLWGGVAVMVVTMIGTAMRTASDFGEKSGEANASLRQLNASVTDLKATIGTLLEGQRRSELEIQRIKDTAVFHDDHIQRLPNTPRVLPSEQVR